MSFNRVVAKGRLSFHRYRVTTECPKAAFKVSRQHGMLVVNGVLGAHGYAACIGRMRCQE